MPLTVTGRGCVPLDCEEIRDVTGMKEDSAGNAASAPSSHDREIRVLTTAVVLYVVVFALKLGAWAISGVMALLAESLHTLSDIFVTGFLLLALWASRKRADRIHMFGYGRAQYVGALVAATLFVAFTALELFREAIPKLFHRESKPAENVPFAIAVLVVSIAIGAWPLIKLMRQKQRGAAARAQLLECVNDELGLFAALAGTILLVLGFPIADPIATLLVALIITFNGIALFRENLSHLLGRAPSPTMIERITSAARSVPGVLETHALRCELVGADSLHVDIHVEVRSGCPIEEADEIAHEVQRRLEALSSGESYVTVHPDPPRDHRKSDPDAAL